jgi:preprotein translocase YajC subunit
VRRIVELRVAAARLDAFLRERLEELGARQASAFLPEKTFVKIATNYIAYIGRVNESELEDILIYDLDAEGRVGSYARAETGRLTVNETNHVYNLLLRDVWHVSVFEGKYNAVPADLVRLSYTNTPAARREQGLRISDMTFLQLREELRRLESRIGVPPPLIPGTPEERQKKLQEFLEALKVGDRVVTNGGIHGSVTKVDGATIQLQIADKVRIEIAKSAIVGYQGQESLADSN